jgi:hypothetical protein
VRRGPRVPVGQSAIDREWPLASNAGALPLHDEVAHPGRLSKRNGSMIDAILLTSALLGLGGASCDPAANVSVAADTSTLATFGFVTLTVTNASASCGFEVDVCEPTTIYEHECGGPLVAKFGCMLPAFFPIPPLGAVDIAWYPRGQDGRPLPDGHYVPAVTVKSDAAPVFAEICVDVQLGGPACPTASYGTGKSGNPFAPAPRIFTKGGYAKLGNSAFGITVDHGPIVGPGILLLGAAPAALPLTWGTVYVDLGAPHVVLPFPMQAGPFGSGGVGNAALPIPAMPSLIGITAHAQVIVNDLGVLGHTPGLSFTICP